LEQAVGKKVATTATIKAFSLEDYLSILRYRKWLLIVPLITLTLVTAVGSQFLTNFYRAQTTILVSTGDVAEEIIPSSVTGSIEDRVRTVREQILSETLLLSVIDTYNLYPGMADGPTEDRIGAMRSSIRVDLQGKDLFRISYIGRDPLTVQNVTNRLAQMFINETYGDRAKSAQATTEFLADRLKEVKTQLDGQEQQVAEFKRKHIGFLPEQMEANQRALDRLQSQMQSLGEQIAGAEDRKVLLETQMAQLQGELMAQGSGELVTKQQQLEALEAQMEQLRQTLTDEHPDVKALKLKINQLRSEIGSNRSVGGREYHVTAVNRPLFQRLQQTTLEINSLRKSYGSIAGQIGSLTGRVGASPAVEQELSVLERDLEKLRETYQDLQKKHMEAQQSEALENQQKGRQFKVVDEARFPERPYKPNRPMLVGGAVMIGIMLGFVAIFVNEHMDHSIRDEDDLTELSGSTVLATIPRFSMETDQVRKANILKLAIGSAAVVGLVLLVLVMLNLVFDVNLLSFLKG
jgi:protein tyrosine kinase modulator